MKSPFPGMDPYLEKFWRDVHARLIIYASDLIQENLPGSLRCRVEERVVLEVDETSGRSLYPDVRVIERRNGPGTQEEGGVAVMVAEPLILHTPDETFTETFLEIIDVATGHKVITVIEFLSPSNKFVNKNLDQYVQKKNDLHQAGVSLVEVDLLREGRRFYPTALYNIPAPYRTHYQVVVRRGWQPERTELYAAPLYEPLPTVPVPLRPQDRDVPLQLQVLIEKCYRNGRYGEDIDYTQPAEPPLGGADIAWAEELLQKAGKRRPG